MDAHSREPAAKFYAVAYALPGGAYDMYQERLRRVASGRRVLEYGCGTGGYSFQLAEAGADVTGVDISPVAVERARETARRERFDERVSFAVMDCERLELEDRSFDVVCGDAILHHLDLRKAYAEISRVLKEDGTAVFIEPLGHNPLINLYRRRTPELRTRDEHPLRIGDVEMAKQFFASVETHFCNLLSLAAVPLRNSSLFTPVAARLRALDSRLFRAVPWLRKHAWMVLVTMREPVAA
ncbi:MAG: class I SAM-dependent methyltransferase [Solirubrobacterales bacterium]